MLKIVLFLLLFATTALSQVTTNYAVYDGKGRSTTIDALITSLADADVVFLGEDHDDVIGHQFQMEIFRRVVETYGAKRKVTLSLEMFERDVQVILNEYLKDQISETHFLRSARPWDNYRRDYRPLVELAKSKKLEVIAANAPRRYVNMVSRNGIASLAGLTPEAKRWLPPFPIAKPSEAYKTKFKSLLGNSGDARLGLDNILFSQSLWDASMAHAVSQSLKKNPRSMVVHLNGWFHTENRLGTVEHLLSYRPKTKAIVITVKPVDDIKKFEHTDAGDYVILTDRKGWNATKRAEVLRRMSEYYDALRTFTADIERTTYNPQLDDSSTFKGKLMFIPAGKITHNWLRIDWVNPHPETLSVVNGSYVMFVPRTNIAYYGSTTTANRFPIIGGMLEMKSAESMEWIEKGEYLGEKGEADGRILSGLRLAPTKRKDYKAIEIWVDQNGLVSKGKYFANNGDTDEITFSNPKANQPLQRERFRVTVGNARRIVS